MNFLIGGISGSLATTVIQPIDFIKVQIQLRSESGGKSLNPVEVAKEIYAENKSFRVFYSGYSAAILRQMTYTGMRLGLFYHLTDLYKSRNNGDAPVWYTKILISLVSGGVSSFGANPCDLALVRMQNDSHMPADKRRGYNGVFDAILRIGREEGVKRLWTGSGPTVARASAMNIGLMVPFEESKRILSPYVENANLKSSLASLAAGVGGALMSLPFDNAKTKLQKMSAGPDGKYPYSGLVDAMTKTVSKEGITRLWVGLPTYYLRVAPHAIVSLISNDVLRKFYAKYAKKD